MKRRFAKPRSADHETKNGASLPSYRGDIINRPGFTAEDREPDPMLMLRGYELRKRRKTDAVAVKTSARAPVKLDLQWALARRVYRFPVALEDVWDGLQPVSIAGAKVWQPTLEDYFVILCAHASKHGWSSLVWIADLAVIVFRYKDRIDWERLLERARHGGAERQVLLGLQLAHDVLAAGIPDAAMASLRADAAIEPLAAEFRRELFRAVEEPAYRRSFMGRGLAYMRSRERLRDRIPYSAMLLKHLFLRATSHAG